MPTEHFNSLFDPERAKTIARPRIDAARTVIDELRNYGHRLFARSSVRPSGNDEEMVILLVYFHLLEMLDGLGILVAEAAPRPARLQLRAMFEALLTLEYLAGADTVRRAHAYLVCDIAERLENYDKLDPTSDAGRAFRDSLASDPDCANVPLSEYAPSDGENLKTALAGALYADAWAELQRLRSKNRLHPH